MWCHMPAETSGHEFLNLSVSKDMELQQLSSFLSIKQDSFFPVSGLI